MIIIIIIINYANQRTRINLFSSCLMSCVTIIIIITIIVVDVSHLTNIQSTNY